MAFSPSRVNKISFAYCATICCPKAYWELDDLHNTNCHFSFDCNI